MKVRTRILPAAVLFLFLAAPVFYSSGPAGVARAQDPIGLGLRDLRAIRSACYVKREWLPGLSDAGSKILLHRSEYEVRQVVIDRGGLWSYRGISDHLLVSTPGKPEDYTRLLEAFSTRLFREMYRLETFREDPEIYGLSSGAYRDPHSHSSHVLVADLNRWLDPASGEFSKAERARIGSMMFSTGSDHLLSEAYFHARAVPQSQGNGLLQMVDTWKSRVQASQRNIEKISDREVEPASEDDTRFLAGAFASLTRGESFAGFPTRSAIVADTSQTIYTIPAEPGVTVYLQLADGVPGQGWLPTLSNIVSVVRDGQGTLYLERAYQNRFVALDSGQWIESFTELSRSK